MCVCVCGVAVVEEEEGITQAPARAGGGGSPVRPLHQLTHGDFLHAKPLQIRKK